MRQQSRTTTCVWSAGGRRRPSERCGGIPPPSPHNEAETRAPDARAIRRPHWRVRAWISRFRTRPPGDLARVSTMPEADHAAAVQAPRQLRDQFRPDRFQHQRVRRIARLYSAKHSSRHRRDPLVVYERPLAKRRTGFVQGVIVDRDNQALRAFASELDRMPVPRRRQAGRTDAATLSTPIVRFIERPGHNRAHVRPIVLMSREASTRRHADRFEREAIQRPHAARHRLRLC